MDLSTLVTKLTSIDLAYKIKLLIDKLTVGSMYLTVFGVALIAIGLSLKHCG